MFTGCPLFKVSLKTGFTVPFEVSAVAAHRYCMNVNLIIWCRYMVCMCGYIGYRDLWDYIMCGQMDWEPQQR